jgi:hypothetical protein
MSHTPTLHTLENWCCLLEELRSIELDTNLETSTIEARLKERQKTIDLLQSLDADLEKIAAERKAGFLCLPEEQRLLAESLVDKGRSILASIMETDRATIDNASQKRTALLGELKNVSLRKSYSGSSPASAYRPPVIVDKKA